MHDSPEPKRCPHCGSAVPEGTGVLLCPVCVLTEGETEEALVETDGQRVGSYTLLEEIARGGMGVVYRARQSGLNRIVALKVLPGAAFASASFRARFQREAETAARLKHPGIVAVHEVGQALGQPFLSMDFIDGTSLATRLAQSRMTPEFAAQILCEVARAVSHAHIQGVAHRDLKPSNILLTSDNHPVLTDFGLACFLDLDSLEGLTLDVMGSPPYLPPERLASGKSSDPVMEDVYGLGAVLYHCLTGRPPFVADSLNALLAAVGESEPVAPRRLNHSVPVDLETICLKCLEKSPAARYPSAAAVADELDRFLRGEPILARPLSPANHLIKLVRRKPLTASLIFALAATMLVGAVVSTLAWRSAASNAADYRAVAEKRRVDLYSANLSAASAARESGNRNQARELLSRCLPSAGESDLRGCEWVIMHQLLQSRELFSLKAHDHILTALAWHPEGHTLLSGGHDGSLKSWQRTKDHQLLEGQSILPPGNPRIQQIQFLPDGSAFLVAEGETIRCRKSGDGGVQYFAGTSKMLSGVVSRGDQHFSGASTMDSIINGGRQYFTGDAYMGGGPDGGAGGFIGEQFYGSVGGGEQYFSDNSVMSLHSELEGGKQVFSGSARLTFAVNSAQGNINAGEQYFSGQSKLEASRNGAVTNGTQFFSGNSSLLATATNAVTGGTQHYSESAFLRASAANSVNATSLTFNDSTHVDIEVSGGVNVGQLVFNDSSYLNANVTNAIVLNVVVLNEQATLRANATGAVSGPSASFTGSTGLVINAANGVDIDALLFSGQAHLDANAAHSITTDGQLFSGSSRLFANHANSVSGGSQLFSGSSYLQINAANGVSNGTQDFEDTALLKVSAGGGLQGGTQTFRSNSSLRIESASGVTGGNQTFVDSSHVRANASGAISATTPDFHFTANSFLETGVVDSVTGGTQYFEDNSRLLATTGYGLGGFLVHNSTAEQHFSDTSSLRAGYSNGVWGSTQYFTEASKLYATAAEAVGGGSVQHFSGNSSLEAGIARAVVGGTQNFTGPNTRLNVLATGGVDGGTQHFRNGAQLVATAAGAVTNGAQHFYDYAFEADVARALNGGNQTFHGTAALNANLATGLNNGTQNFLGNSTLDAKVAGAVSGGTQNFTEDSGIIFRVGGAVTGGTQNFTGVAGSLGVDPDPIEVTITLAESFAGTSTQNFINSTLDYAVADAVGDGTTQNFDRSSGVVSASYGIMGGRQNVNNFASLFSSAAHGIHGGTQTIQAGSYLYAYAADSIDGGTQNVFGAFYAIATNSVSGGNQTVNGFMVLGSDSFGRPPEANTLSGGRQHFEGNGELIIHTANNFGTSAQTFHLGKLFALASGAVGGGNQTFTGDIYDFDPFDSVPGFDNGGGTLYAATENSITGGHQEFLNASQLIVGSVPFFGNGLPPSSGYAVSGGTQTFRDSSVYSDTGGLGLPLYHNYGDPVLDANGDPVLDANGDPTIYQGGELIAGQTKSMAFGVTGSSTQNFHNGASFVIQNVTANPSAGNTDPNNHATIGGGTQNFHDNTQLQASGWAVSGGVQNFNDNSFLFLQGLVTGGTQTYHDNSKLIINRGLVDGADITLHDNSSISLLPVAESDPLTGQPVYNAVPGLTGKTNLTFVAGNDVGGTLYLNGHSNAIGRLSSTGEAGIITNEPHNNPVVFGGPGGGLSLRDATLTVSFDGAPSTFGGVIKDGTSGGKLGLTKTGNGTLVLTNQNLYTGTTTLAGGGLTLDFSAGGASAQIIDIRSRLVLHGGTELKIIGRNDLARSQSLPLAIATGASRVVLDRNGPNQLFVGFGSGSGISRSVGGTTDFTLGGARMSFINVAGEGVQFGWATLNGGSTFAHIGQSNEVTGLTAYDGTWGAGMNTDVVSAASAATNPSANAVTNTLRFNETAANTVTLSGTNVISTGGILITASVGANLSKITGGSITSGNSDKDLIIHQYNTSAAFEIASAIVDNNGATGLTKSGPGTLILSGTNTYTGITTINEGKLAINGDVYNNVTAQNGGIFGGNARIHGSLLVHNGGILAPGNSPGLTTADDATWGPDGIYRWEINDALGMAGVDSGWDHLSVQTTLTITATSSNPYVMNIHSLSQANLAGLMANFNAGQNHSWTIATANGGITGFDPSLFTINLAAFSNPVGGSFSLALDGSNQNLNLIYTIPEPSTSMLLLGGGVALTLLRRRRLVGRRETA